MKKKKSNTLLLILVVLLVSALGCGIFLMQQRARREDMRKLSQEDLAKRYRPSITYGGASYPLKRNMSSLLLIGTDNYIDDDKQVYDDEYYHNFNLADFLVILVFDHDRKTVTPFQVGDRKSVV